MGGGELYPGEEADLALAGAGEMEATEKEPLLEKPAAAAAAGKIAGGKGEVTLGRGLVGLGGALVVGMCLVSLAAPHHLPRALASPERRRMLDAFDAVQTAAGGEWTDEDMHWHAETISPLPLMERLKRHYGVSGHDHHHPQGDAYAPLPRADGRRGLQEDGGGMLTEQTTERLKIKVDYSNMSPDDAMPYATALRWARGSSGTSRPRTLRLVQRPSTYNNGASIHGAPGLLPAKTVAVVLRMCTALATSAAKCATASTTRRRRTAGASVCRRMC